MFYSYHTFSTVPQLCSDQLGMQSGDIHDSQITASSEQSSATLSRPKSGLSGWRPAVFTDSWLQINLLRQQIVTGVYTYSRAGYNHYITRYRVSTSLDGVNWNNVTDEEGQSEVKFN